MKSILARLYEEGGEIARIMNHLHGDKLKRADKKEQNLEEEVGDMLYTLVCLANSQRLDLDRAFRKSFDKVAKRDTDRFTKS